MPERLSGVAFRVEGVHAVVFGSHEDHVVLAFAGDGHGGNIERLRVKIAVHLERRCLAEPRGINVRRSQRSLGENRARAAVAVLRSEHLGHSADGEAEGGNSEDNAALEHLRATIHYD